MLDVTYLIYGVTYNIEKTEKQKYGFFLRTGKLNVVALYGLVITWVCFVVVESRYQDGSTVHRPPKLRVILVENLDPTVKGKHEKSFTSKSSAFCEAWLFAL